MNKTVAIIFSRDRPLQLDLTLRSLFNCADDFSVFDVKIIYKASNTRFENAYFTLASEWPGVEFVKETGFKDNLINAIDDYEYIFFLVDDTIAVNHFNADEITRLLEKNNSILGFSLRLGKNTGYCFSCNMPQDIPIMKEYNKNISTYFWPKSQFDFSYCMEVSSSIFRTKDILQVITDRNFKNPNQLEDVLYANLWQFVCFKFRMACYNQSVAFANPLNQSTETNKSNRTGNNDKYSIENLLDIYEKGGRIRSDQFYGLITNAAHQLVELF
jgi:hypothetical protein